MEKEQKPKFFKSPNRDTWVKGKLRQMSLRWPPRSEALKRARKERGKYQCGMCLELFGSHSVHLDHINPVVDLQTGFVDWNTFIDRLFPDVEGWQVLCETCHGAKTSMEDDLRTHFSQKKKLAKAKKV